MFDKIFKNFKSRSESSSTSGVKSKLVTLIILDGFGVHPDPLGNAIIQAKTPFMDTIWTKGHSTLLHASGIHVGLPELENGNSEVGHLNLGSGQVVFQSLPRINDAIKNGNFHENPIIAEAIKVAKERGTKFHLMGILSDGGVHGHIDHLFELMRICKDFGIDPYIHAFMDGRDTSMFRGKEYLQRLLRRISDLGVGHIASISGRYYSMDRDKRWERTQLAYDSIRGYGKRLATDPIQLIEQAYKEGENDQIILPTTIVDREGSPIGPAGDRDVMLFFNFREDRARQLTKAFAIEDFPNIVKEVKLQDIHFVTMTGYEDGLPTHVVFPPKKIEMSLAHVLAEKGLKQLHISETEKYTHVTYFFNGGIEEPHQGEDFFNIPSPKVYDYDEVPAMSAEIIRDEVVYRLNHNTEFNYSLLLLNFANPDMLGHTGNIEKTIRANEIVDQCVKDIVEATIANSGVAIVTADHGNCETMINRNDGSINVYHTNNPVPFVLVDKKEQMLRKGEEQILKIGSGKDVPVSGLLADVAPTVLGILDVDQPESMTGLNLMDVID